MTKKGILILVFAGTLAEGVFAQADFRFGVGAGGFYIQDFGGGYRVAPPIGLVVSQEIPNAVGGGFVFFDATYAELSLGLFSGRGTAKTKTSNETREAGVSYSGLDISLLGKYPVELNHNLFIFPLLGTSYRVMFSAKEGRGNGFKLDNVDIAPEDLNAIWIKLGCGSDVSFSENVYIRVQALYGVRLANTFETDGVDKAKKNDENLVMLVGHGPEAKIAVGYNF